MVADDEFEVARDTVHAAPPPRAPEPRRRPRTDGPVPWLVMTLVLVLAGIALVPPRGLPTTALLPDAVGVLTLDVSEPPEEVWRVPIGGWQTGITPLTLVGDVAVALTGEHAQGVSVETGETRWEVPIGAAVCTIGEALTCVEGAGGTDSTILRVDVASGEESRLALPRTMAAATAGADVVTLTQRDGEWMLQRVTMGGALRWAMSMANLPATPTGSDPAGTQLVVLGTHVYVAFQGAGIAADARTGAVLEENSAPVVSTPYGYVRLSTVDAPNALLDEEGAVLFENVVVTPDDDPHSSYELAWEGQSIAVERGGEVLWQTEPDSIALARVDGVLVTAAITVDADQSVMSGYDIATGEELWSNADGIAVRLAAGPALLTTGASSSLAAVEARTGETLWSFDTEPMLAAVPTSDGLIVHLGSELVRVSW